MDSMQKLFDTIVAAESSDTRALAAYLFLPPAPAKRAAFILDIEASVAVEAKELLCELHLYAADGTTLEAQEPNWPLSSRLLAPYHYLPAVAETEIVELKTFQSSTSFAAAVIQLRPWKRRFEAGEVASRRCVASERISLGGKHFMQYHELPALEIKRD